MTLTAMKFKNYTWPHNPTVYTMEYQRSMAASKVPFGRYRLQSLGLGHRIMRGRGEFVGAGAYEEFKKLATVFYSEGPGQLVHPNWATTNAYFVSLTLAQEPRPNYVGYSFVFWEAERDVTTTLREVPKGGAAGGGGSSGSSGSSGGSGGGTAAAGAGSAAEAVYHTVTRGENLWGIAKKYGRTLNQVIALNPQIKNPNLITVGQKVRVK